MGIYLSDFERGEKPDGDYDARLLALQQRLGRLHSAHIAHGHRTMIVFEGWDAAGKGGAIRRLTAEWDPRYYEVWPISAPSPDEKDRHFLYRFWAKLPGSRDIQIFDRSWYGRVLVERVEGFATTDEWRRGYDEINEFEAQQRDIGTHMMKFFLHITQEEQDDRLRARLAEPYKQWKVTAEDFRNREKRAAYLDAMEDMFDRTDTRWAPWQVIDANNKKSARLEVLGKVADQLEAVLPSNYPPLTDAVMQLAADTFGTH